MRTYLVTIKHAGHAIFELVHATDGFDAAIAAQQRHPQAEVRRLDIVDDRHFETGLGQLLDRLLNHRSALSQATMCHHHRMTGTEHRQSLSSKGNVL